jgi:hypothetical protein
MDREILRREFIVPTDPDTGIEAVNAFSITYVARPKESRLPPCVLECNCEYEDLPKDHPVRLEYEARLQLWMRAQEQDARIGEELVRRLGETYGDTPVDPQEARRISAEIEAQLSPEEQALCETAGAEEPEETLRVHWYLVVEDGIDEQDILNAIKSATQVIHADDAHIMMLRTYYEKRRQEEGLQP